MGVIGNAQSVVISLVRLICLMSVQRPLYVALSKVTERNKIEERAEYKQLLSFYAYSKYVLFSTPINIFPLISRLYLCKYLSYILYTATVSVVPSL